MICGLLLLLSLPLMVGVGSDALADGTWLVALYNAANGAGWTSSCLTNWNTASPASVCSSSWSRITCGGGVVTSVALNGCNLQGGPLPDIVGTALASCTVLHLYSNSLTGTLPSSWSSLSLVQDLDLHGNSLTGTLPSSWSSMTSLQYCWLYSCSLTGSLPSSYSSLSALQRFAVSYNSLTGTLPMSYGSLTSLQILGLESNSLTGSLPPSYSSMSALQTLHLFSNSLNGTLPSSWYILHPVGTTNYDLTSNYLTGDIPSSWLWTNATITGSYFTSNCLKVSNMPAVVATGRFIAGLRRGRAMCDTASFSRSAARSTSIAGSTTRSTSSWETASYSGSATRSTSSSVTASNSEFPTTSTSSSETVSKSGSATLSTSYSRSAERSTSYSGSATSSKSPPETVTNSGSATRSTSSSETASNSVFPSRSTSSSQTASKSYSATRSTSSSETASKSVSATGSSSSSETASKTGSATRSTSASETVSKTGSATETASKSLSDFKRSRSGSSSLSTSILPSLSDLHSLSASSSNPVSSLSGSTSNGISGSISETRSLSPSRSSSLERTRSPSSSQQASGSTSVSLNLTVSRSATPSNTPMTASMQGTGSRTISFSRSPTKSQSPTESLSDVASVSMSISPTNSLSVSGGPSSTQTNVSSRTSSTSLTSSISTSFSKSDTMEPSFTVNTNSPAKSDSMTASKETSFSSTISTTTSSSPSHEVSVTRSKSVVSPTISTSANVRSRSTSYSNGQSSSYSESATDSIGSETCGRSSSPSLSSIVTQSQASSSVSSSQTSSSYVSLTSSRTTTWSLRHTASRTLLSPPTVTQSPSVSHILSESISWSASPRTPSPSSSYPGSHTDSTSLSASVTHSVNTPTNPQTATRSVTSTVTRSRSRSVSPADASLTKSVSQTISASQQHSVSLQSASPSLTVTQSSTAPSSLTATNAIGSSTKSLLVSSSNSVTESRVIFSSSASSCPSTSATASEIGRSRSTSLPRSLSSPESSSRSWSHSLYPSLSMSTTLTLRSTRSISRSVSSSRFSFSTNKTMSRPLMVTRSVSATANRSQSVSHALTATASTSLSHTPSSSSSSSISISNSRHSSTKEPTSTRIATTTLSSTPSNEGNSTTGSLSLSIPLTQSNSLSRSPTNSVSRSLQLSASQMLTPSTSASHAASSSRGSPTASSSPTLTWQGHTSSRSLSPTSTDPEESSTISIFDTPNITLAMIDCWGALETAIVTPLVAASSICSASLLQVDAYAVYADGTLRNSPYELEVSVSVQGVEDAIEVASVISLNWTGVGMLLPIRVTLVKPPRADSSFFVDGESLLLTVGYPIAAVSHTLRIQVRYPLCSQRENTMRVEAPIIPIAMPLSTLQALHLVSNSVMVVRLDAPVVVGSGWAVLGTEGGTLLDIPGPSSFDMPAYFLSTTVPPLTNSAGPSPATLSLGWEGGDQLTRSGSTSAALLLVRCPLELMSAGSDVADLLLLPNQTWVSATQMAMSILADDWQCVFCGQGVGVGRQCFSVSAVRQDTCTVNCSLFGVPLSGAPVDIDLVHVSTQASRRVGRLWYPWSGIAMVPSMELSHSSALGMLRMSVSSRSSTTVLSTSFFASLAGGCPNGAFIPMKALGLEAAVVADLGNSTSVALPVASAGTSLRWNFDTDVLRRIVNASTGSETHMLLTLTLRTSSLIVSAISLNASFISEDMCEMMTEEPSAGASMPAPSGPWGSVSGCALDVFPVTSFCKPSGGDIVKISTLAAAVDVSSANSSSIAAVLDFGAGIVVVCPLTSRSPLSLSPNGGLEVSCVTPQINASVVGAAPTVDVLLVNVTDNTTVIRLNSSLSFADSPNCPTNAATGAVCSGQGTCNVTTLQCTCFSDGANGYWNGPLCNTCQSGYYGIACLQKCLGFVTCSGHGVCSDGRLGNGQCACVANPAQGFWGTADCSDCATGYYGSDCTQRCAVSATNSSLVCSGVGICDDGVNGVGVCACNTGFTGAGCDVCLPGYFGALCSPCPTSSELSQYVCSGRGVCSDGLSGTGTCTCSTGFSGAACTWSCPVSFNATCGWGSCVGNGSCSCTVPVTMAADGSCSTCVDGRWGPRCDNVCGVCVHGTCNPLTGQCVCSRGYWNVSCDAECPGGARSPCSNRGTCAGNGTCSCFRDFSVGFFVGPTCGECDPWYASNNCSVPCPVFNSSICGYRGVCYNGECIGRCRFGYWGAGCEYECPGGGGNPCSSRGTCDETNGVCTCFSGAYGGACDKDCPGGYESPCSNHGNCTSTGACRCDSEYARGFFTGTSCDVCVSPFTGTRCSTPCDLRSGSIEGGACLCIEGFIGPSCNISCPLSIDGLVCAGHGVCVSLGNEAFCDCSSDYFGGDCSVQCNSAVCAAAGLLRTQCNQSTGACECKHSVSGYFTGSNCNDCVPGYWGAECERVCPCSGRGTCSRYDAVCNCAAGFGGSLSGSDCSTCAPGYIGVNCDVHNVEISTIGHGDFSTANSGYPQKGVAFHDPVTDVVLVGSSPLASFMSTAWLPTLTPLQTISIPSPVVAVFALNSTHLIAWLTPPTVNSPLSSILLDRVELAAATHATDLTAMVAPVIPFSRRVDQQLAVSSSSQFIFAMDTNVSGCSATAALVHSPTSFVMVTLSCRGFMVGSVSITSVSTLPYWIGFLPGNMLMVSWTAPTQFLKWRLVAMSFNASLLSVWFDTNDTAVHLPECSSRGGCNRVSYCLSESARAPLLVCAANTNLESGNALVFFTLFRANASLASLTATVVVQATNVNAAIVDVGYGFAIYAFDGPTAPALVRLQLSPLQLVTFFALQRIGGERPSVLMMTLNGTTRTLWLSLATSQAVQAVAVNLFAIRIVAPYVFDQRGGVTVTVRGLGFIPDPVPVCEFQPLNGLWTSQASPSPLASSPAIFVDDSTLLCVSKQVQSNTTCSEILFNVWYGGRSTSTTIVGSLRPLTASVSSASAAPSGRAAAWFASYTTVTLRGYGFVPGATYAKCRLTTAHGGGVVFDTPAEVVNSMTALCHVPPSEPTAPGALLRYSHDGFVYSATSVVFAVVGEVGGLSATLAFAAPLLADVVVHVPSVIVRTTDAFGNVLGFLDTNTWTLRCVTTNPLAMSSIEEASAGLNSSSTLVQQAVAGEARFSNVFLAAPDANLAVELYFFATSNLFLQAMVTVTVAPGRPVQLTFAKTVAISGWRSGVLDKIVLPEFQLQVMDAVGNVVVNASQLPLGATLEYNTRESLDDPRRVTTTSTLDAGSSVYAFVGVGLRSPFDELVTLSFSVTFPAIRGFRYALQQQRCMTLGEYGVAGTFECKMCPSHAHCDGSTVFTVDRGYWHGATSSPYTYACAPPDSCATATECAPGYEGAWCGSCSSGYGRILSACAACTSSTTTIVLIVVTIVAVVAAVWALGLRTLPFTAVADVTVRLVTPSTTRSMIPIVIKLVMSHLQLLSMMPLGLLAVGWLSSALASSGSWTVMAPSFLNVGCVVGARVNNELNATLMFAGAVVVGSSLVGAGISVFAHHRYRQLAHATRRKIGASWANHSKARVTRYRAVDRAVVESIQARYHCVEEILRNHKEFLGDYVGDTEWKAPKDDLMDWWLNRDIDIDPADHSVPLPLEEVIELHGYTPQEPIPAELPKPSLASRWLNTSAVTLVIVGFLLYPTIIQAAVRVLQCRSVHVSNAHTASVVAYDPIMDCSSDAYRSLAPAGGAVLVVIGCGVPLLSPLLISLIQHATCSGNLIKALQMFHFTTGSYRVWFWESVSLVRKAALVAAMAFSSTTETSCLISFWILTVSVGLNIFLRPWTNSALGELEVISLGSLAFTALALAVLSHSAANASSSTLGDGIRFGMLVVVGASNTIAMIAFVWEFFRATRIEATRLIEERLPSLLMQDQIRVNESLRTRCRLLKIELDRVHRATIMQMLHEATTVLKQKLGNDSPSHLPLAPKQHFPSSVERYDVLNDEIVELSAVEQSSQRAVSIDDIFGADIELEEYTPRHSVNKINSSATAKLNPGKSAKTGNWFVDLQSNEQMEGHRYLTLTRRDDEQEFRVDIPEVTFEDVSFGNTLGLESYLDDISLEDFKVDLPPSMVINAMVPSSRTRLDGERSACAPGSVRTLTKFASPTAALKALARCVHTLQTLYRHTPRQIMALDIDIEIAEREVAGRPIALHLRCRLQQTLCALFVAEGAFVEVFELCKNILLDAPTGSYFQAATQSRGS